MQTRIYMALKTRNFWSVGQPIKERIYIFLKNDLKQNEPLGSVHKLRLQEEGGSWSKKSTFCKLLYHRKCKRRGVGGQKKTNLVNVVCELSSSVALQLQYFF